MSTPTEAFLSWFHALPPSHKTDIAALVSYRTPGFSCIDMLTSDTIVEDFTKVIRAHCTSVLKDVGAAVTLRAAVDFLFLSHGDREGWKENQAVMQSLAEQTGSEKFERIASEMPLRREQWLRTCAQWQSFRAEHLSDQVLETWSLK